MGALIFFFLGTMGVWWLRNTGLSTLSEAQVLQERQRWDREGPPDYNITVRVEGLRPAEYHAKVRDGSTIVFTIDGRAVEPTETWSVPGMFATISADLRNQAENKGIALLLRGEFHPRWGYPRRYQRFDLNNRNQAMWEVVDFNPVGSSVP